MGSTADELRVDVDFLIIGGGKSGTTSLYYYLAQHPDVFLARIKEPRFFLLPGLDIDTTAEQRAHFCASFPEGVATRAAYRDLFRDAAPGQVKGEASVQYLSSDTAAANIGRYAPQARLICILRNPMDRAYSNYAHGRRDGLEHRPSILDALRETGPDHVFFYPGFYSRHLECYAQRAPRNPLRVWLYEELLQDPVGTVQSMLRYLGVDDRFVPDTSFKANVSGEASPANVWARIYDAARRNRLRRHPMVQRFMSVELKQRIVKTLASRADRDRVKQHLTETEWDTLMQVYEADIRRLETLLGRSLDVWRRYPYGAAAAGS